MNARGFSLIEAMVALAVFSTVAVGLISLNSQSVRLSAQLQNRFLASVVAENVIVEAITSPTLESGTPEQGQQTQRGRRFAWERIVTPTPQAGVLRIDVAVRADGEAQVLVRQSVLHRVEEAR